MDDWDQPFRRPHPNMLTVPSVPNVYLESQKSIINQKNRKETRKSQLVDVISRQSHPGLPQSLLSEAHSAKIKSFWQIN